MIAIVGLGNPEEIHFKNRHNVGFMAVDNIVDNFKLGAYKTKFQCKIITSKINDIPVILLKPLTFMNLSGISINKVVKFYDLDIENIIVIHDDLDLKLGKVKIKIGGGNGGHNGLKNIDSYIGPNYRRIRIGIDRPNNKELVNKFVLSDFDKKEQHIIQNLLNNISKNIENIISTNNISKIINELS